MSRQTGCLSLAAALGLLLETRVKYYLHLYDVTQADLNWHNPHVREELF